MKNILHFGIILTLFSCSLPSAKIIKPIKINEAFLNDTLWYTDKHKTITLLSFKQQSNLFKTYYYESQTQSLDEALKQFEQAVTAQPGNYIFTSEIKDNDYVWIPVGNDAFKVSFFSNNTAHLEVIVGSGQPQLDYWFNKYK